MTRIVRVFTDNILFLIRINPYDLYDPCSIIGCGLATLCTTQMEITWPDSYSSTDQRYAVLLINHHLDINLIEDGPIYGPVSGHF
jgi:hypothetical protein